MTNIDVQPPIVVTLPPPKPLSKFELEMAAFRRLVPTLLKDYRNKYVAIHQEQLVGSGDELIKVALEAYDKFGYQPIYVDLVTDEPVRPCRIPHFKILSAW